jgi:hypothetical protein
MFLHDSVIHSSIKKKYEDESAKKIMENIKNNDRDESDGDESDDESDDEGDRVRYGKGVAVNTIGNMQNRTSSQFRQMPRPTPQYSHQRTGGNMMEDTIGNKLRELL